MCTQGFLGSLITNLKLLLKNYIVYTICLNKLCLVQLLSKLQLNLFFRKLNLMTPSYRKSKKRKTTYVPDEKVELAECENGISQAIFISSSFDSDESDTDSDSEDKERIASMRHTPNRHFKQILNDYDQNQSKLEPDHCYEWVKGEMKYVNLPENELLLSDAKKKVFSRTVNNSVV